MLLFKVYECILDKKLKGDTTLKIEYDKKKIVEKKKKRASWVLAFPQLFIRGIPPM